MGRDDVTRFIEESDCVVLLGTFMTDLNLGIYTANLDPGKCIYATSEQLRIHHHHYHGVLLGDFIRQLSAKKPTPPARPLPTVPTPAGEEFRLDPEAPITIARLIERLNESLKEDTIVIADIGDSLFAATELVIRGRTEFISPAYYTSMGFSVPAAVGAQVARRDQRVVVLCGDGAFQMTGMELSTIVRHGFAPIVIVLDNGGYGTERCLHPGDWTFNEIHPWHYSKLPEVLGGGTGFETRTERELDEALTSAWDDTKAMSLIHVHLRRDDRSQVLDRLATRLSKRV